MSMDSDVKVGLSIGTVVMIVLIGLVALGMWGCPQYDVYQQGLAGQASLARAEQDRQIKVAEARALKESSVFKADAEVIRAKGVAEANKIIGNSLKENEAYLRWLFVEQLGETKNQIIYLPTEAGLPILEAQRK